LINDLLRWLESPEVRPIAVPVFAITALELFYLFFYRRAYPRLLDRLRYQVWMASCAAAAFVAFSPFGGDWPNFAAWVVAITIVLSADVVYRLVDVAILERIKDRRGRPAIPRLVRDVLTWVVIALAIVAASKTAFGSDLKWLGIQGAALTAVLGFALQDVLKNVFAGMSIQAEESFEVGDWISYGGAPAQILDMTWRTTRLRDNLGVLHVVPNANLGNDQIVSYGSGVEPVAFSLFVGVHYSSPPKLVKQSLERAALNTPGAVPIPSPAALVSAFGDSAVVYEVRVWTRDVHQISRFKDAVHTRIWYQLHRDGFGIPFPIRTVEMFDMREVANQRSADQAQRFVRELGRIDLFRPLSEEARLELATAARVQHFDAGERVVEEGQKGDSLLLLLRGSVAVTKSGADIGATTVSLATLREGAVFGEMSLLTGAPRSASVTAEGPVEAMVIDRAAIAPLLERDPELAETLSKILAERVAATAARFEDKKDAMRKLEETDQHTLLKRIRDFFKLG
jgi:small-conductance mechanosensitive channel/CRP-like cAMP-binding protein